jgi:hypothetical protein
MSIDNEGGNINYIQLLHIIVKVKGKAIPVTSREGT